MLLFLFGLWGASCVLTGGLRHRTIMDVPNERSSHMAPIAKGGGLAFVSCFLGGLSVLAYVYHLPENLVYALFIMGASTACVGYWDDRANVAALWRLMIQICIVSVVSSVLAGGDAPWIILSIGILLSLVNIFNFLDGIDGYAAMESIFIAAVMAWVSWCDGFPEISYILSTLAASVSGFALWNMPKAKIFMGDVGSGFLGGILGVIAIYMSQTNLLYLWIWGILMGGFLVDAGITLAMRAARREKIWQAHCQHGYQHAAKTLRSHAKVTGGLFVINSVWLYPWAYVTWQGLCPPILALSIAYLPLVGLAWYWRAGKASLK